MPSPNSLIPTTILQLPEDPSPSNDTWMAYVHNGVTYKVQVSSVLNVSGVPTTRQVIAGTGLTGGGQLSSNVTLSVAPGGIGYTQLDTTGVSAGSYGTSTDIPVITVDDKGRVTAVTTTPLSVSGFVPTSRTVTAGTGLLGGGALNNDITLSVNLSNSAPLALGPVSAGSSTQPARGDHVHPPINLSNTNQTEGTLDITRGGTGADLTQPNAGGIIYSNGNQLAVTSTGSSSQVLLSNGLSAPSWYNQSTLSVGQANNLSGGAANRIAYQTAPNTTNFLIAPTVTDTFLRWDGSQLVWSPVAGAGTVTSVAVSGGTTGLTTSGGPITSAGTITFAGTLIAANGGTGLSSYSGGDMLYYTSGDAFSKLSIGTNGQILTSTGSAPQWTTLSGVAVTTFSGGTTGFTPNVATGGAVTLAGTLNVANGGTGATTLTGYVKGSGTSAFTASSTIPGADVSGNISGNAANVTGTVAVANGGTGATTLTGYVKGSGTSAMTASATIPNTDITGLGTMSTQAANNVAITGGAINGTTVGSTTPAAGTFTSVAMTSGTITTAPTNGNDIVNKTYADAIAAGINFHQACRLATAAALPSCTYNNGSSGVGATLTATANGALSVDATLVVVANRILVKNQANQAYNGVYTVTQVGDGSNPFILTRATDYNTAGSGVNQIDAGDFFLITAGSTLANTSWVQQTPLPITVGTTALVFSQFGAPITYLAGTGLSESPAYTFNIANTGVTSGNYGGAATVPALSINAQGQITSATNTSIAIAASQVTSGQLAIAQGGTNTNATPTAGAVPYGTGTAYAFSAAGTSSQVLLSGGTSSPTWADQSSLSVGTATNATNATNTAITDDTSTNSTMYPTWVTANTGNLPQKVTSTKLTFNPSTGLLTATGGISGGTF